MTFCKMQNTVKMNGWSEDTKDDDTGITESAKKGWKEGR